MVALDAPSSQSRTRFPVCALRSVELGTPDLSGSLRFYTEVWGLTVVARQGETAYLAATGTDHHVLALSPAERPELRSVTFRAAAAEDLAALARSALAQGARVVAGPALNEGPEGGLVLALVDPWGATLRVVHGDRRNPEGRAVPGLPLRLAHVNLNSTEVDATAGFYEKALGFRLTDRSRLMGFVRCNSDHHAVVIADAKVNGLNHVAFLVPDWESVMRAAGRLVDHGFPIAWGVGRHGPGDNVFAYFVDPAGFVVEYTAEVLQVDDGYRVRGPDEWVWPPGRTDQWGIAPPKAERVKAAQTAIPFAAPPPAASAEPAA